MTVNTTQITSGPYLGNDVADEFSYTFRVEDKTQLIVYETDDQGVQTTLMVDTDYTVAGIGDDGGGLITRVAGPLPTGYEWYIRSDYKQTQGTAFGSQGGFFPDVHEAAMDKLTFLVQQITDILSRSMRLSESYTGDTITSLPDPESQKYLRWKTDLSGFENVELAATGILTVGISIGDIVELINDGSGNGVFPYAALREGLDIGNFAKLIDDGSGNGVFPEGQLRIGLTVGDVPKLVDIGGATPGLPAIDGSLLTGIVSIQRGYIDGLIMSNAVDTDHDISIAIGSAFDSLNADKLDLESVITKQIDAVWAAGDNVGGLFSGSVAIDTWYHLFLIKKDSDGSIDAGFDTSITAANIPAGYTAYRRIGSVLTDGSGNIYQFIQIGDCIIWVDPVIDYTMAGTGTSEHITTTRTPLGVPVVADLAITSTGGSGYFRHPDTTDLAISIGAVPLPLIWVVNSGGLRTSVHTNDLSQIKYRMGSNETIQICTRSYNDQRGRDL